MLFLWCRSATDLLWLELPFFIASLMVNIYGFAFKKKNKQAPKTLLMKIVLNW